jgi:prophage DNA circulation protein
MYKLDAQEAAGICQRVLTYMLALAPSRGRPGSDFRTAVGDFLADAEALIQNDEAGQPLADIFDLARNASIGQPQLAAVRAQAALEKPTTVGGLLMKNSLIEFSLATEGRIIADIKFVNRDDVEALGMEMSVAFAPMQEIAADDMAQAVYQALISLHAAIAYHLAVTALPLPQMLNYQFYDFLPSVVLSYRLYADAGRADEVVAGNKIVHPAFCLREGRALSS